MDTTHARGVPDRAWGPLASRPGPRLLGGFVAGVMVCGMMLASLGLTAQPDPDDLAARLERIERGLFVRESRLPKSETESLEHLLRELSKTALGPRNDSGIQLDKIERLLRDVERKIGDIDRGIARAGPADLRREVESLQRDLESAEREANDARRRADATERQLMRLERRVATLERRR